VETPKSLTAWIFANGDGNDGPVVRQILASTSDAWVIAADGGARHAQYFGLRVDTLIGDMDSLTAAEVAALEAAGADIHRYPADKNETDLELALLHAAQAGVQCIRVFSAIGDRLDQTLGNLYLQALPALRTLDIRMVAGKQEAWLVYPGKTVIQGAAGDTVSLIPISGEARGVRTEHLEYPLHDETLTFGPARGISNVMETDTARVWLREGALLVVHTLGRA
jgi:thiamine pyrophosphokinase